MRKGSDVPLKIPNLKTDERSAIHPLLIDWSQDKIRNKYRIGTIVDSNLELERLCARQIVKNGYKGQRHADRRRRLEYTVPTPATSEI